MGNISIHQTHPSMYAVRPQNSEYTKRQRLELDPSIQSIQKGRLELDPSIQSTQKGRDWSQTPVFRVYKKVETGVRPQYSEYTKRQRLELDPSIQSTKKGRDWSQTPVFRVHKKVETGVRPQYSEKLVRHYYFFCMKVLRFTCVIKINGQLVKLANSRTNLLSPSQNENIQYI